MDVNTKLKTDNDRLTKTTLQMKDEKGRFCSFVHPCVWELLDAHVSFANVNSAINSVLKMVGMKTEDEISPTTIRNMSDLRIRVAQLQLKEAIDKENTTLSTEETPKTGSVYMGYTIQVDEEK